MSGAFMPRRWRGRPKLPLIEIKRPRLASGVQEQDPRHCDLFASLDARAWDAVLERTRPVRIAAGKVLFCAGDDARRFYFLRQGAMKLVRRNADGQEKVLEVVRPGGTFAEAVMFVRQSYPVDAEAIEPSELLAFDSDHYRALLRENPDASMALLSRYARRIHFLLESVHDLALRSAAERLAEYVLERLEPGAPGFEIGFSKQVLAARLGMRPESLSRAFAQLERRQLVRVSGAYVQVLDRSELIAMLSGT